MIIMFFPESTNLILSGFQTYYNFSKKHGGIGKKTPAEKAGIIVDGSNKWKTLINNASLYRESV